MRLKELDSLFKALEFEGVSVKVSITVAVAANVGESVGGSEAFAE